MCGSPHNGMKHVFMFTGGGAMFLNDAFGLEKRVQIVPIRKLENPHSS